MDGGVHFCYTSEMDTLIEIMRERRDLMRKIEANRLRRNEAMAVAYANGHSITAIRFETALSYKVIREIIKQVTDDAVYALHSKATYEVLGPPDSEPEVYVPPKPRPEPDFDFSGMSAEHLAELEAYREAVAAEHAAQAMRDTPDT